jgi:hypothetical protein
MSSDAATPLLQKANNKGGVNNSVNHSAFLFAFQT